MKKVELFLWIVVSLIFLNRQELSAQKYVQMTNLPAIYIETENNAPIVSKEDYINATLHYVDDKGVTTYDVLEVRGRGNSTWGLAKKPYRLKFGKKTEFLGPERAKAKSWTLLANYGDKALIRNAVASQIGSFVGQPFTAAAQFVDLTLNGTYLGNYQVSDQMEVREKRVEIDEQDEVPAEDANITGGYFLEVDGFATSEPVYYRTKKNILVTVKSPDEDIIVDRQLNYIKNHMQLFEDALFSADFKDEVKGYRPYVDSLTLASWYISTELTGNVDGFWSTYMYKKKDDQKFYWGPLWDYDIAFNNCNRVGDVSRELMMNKGFGSDLTKVWMIQMWKDPWFVRLINRTWKDCVKRGIEEHLIQYIDSMAGVLEQSQAMNFKKWPIDQRAYNEIVLFSTYREGVEYLKKFIRDHCAYLTEEFAKAEKANELIENPTPEFVLDKNFYYKLYNKGNGNGIDVEDVNGSLVCTWSPERDRESQQWEIRNADDGYYWLVNRASGLALYDAAVKEGDVYKEGSQLEQRKLRTTGYRYQWMFVPINSGNSYVIVNRLTNLALNNNQGLTTNGNKVLTWLNNNENANKDTRQWRIEKDEPIEEATAIERVQHETEYAVLYNQVTRQVRFVSENSELLKGTAEVYDEAGVRIMYFNITETADLSHLRKGVYILKWVENKKDYSVKILVR